MHEEKINSKTKNHGMAILFGCLFLFLVGGGFFLFQDKLLNQKSENQILDKRLYAKKSTTSSSPRVISIGWDSFKDSGYVFVTGANLFAAGPKGLQNTGEWVPNGQPIEFCLYEDKERTKPIAKLVVIKTGNTIKQSTTDLKESPHDSSANPAPISSPTSTAVSTPTPSPTSTSSSTSSQPATPTEYISKHKKKK